MQSVIIAQYICFLVIIKRLYIYYRKNLEIYTDWFRNISGLRGLLDQTTTQNAILGNLLENMSSGHIYILNYCMFVCMIGADGLT